MARVGMVDVYFRDNPETPVEMWPVDAKHALVFSTTWKSTAWTDEDVIAALDVEKAAAIPAKKTRGGDSSA